MPFLLNKDLGFPQKKIIIENFSGSFLSLLGKQARCWNMMKSPLSIWELQAFFWHEVISSAEVVSQLHWKDLPVCFNLVKSQETSAKWGLFSISFLVSPCKADENSVLDNSQSFCILLFDSLQKCRFPSWTVPMADTDTFYSMSVCILQYFSKTFKKVGYSSHSHQSGISCYKGLLIKAKEKMT